MDVSNIEELAGEYIGTLRETGFTRLEFTLYCGREEYSQLVDNLEKDRRIRSGKGYLVLSWVTPDIHIILRPQPNPTITVPIEEYINAPFIHMGL